MTAVALLVFCTLVFVTALAIPVKGRWHDDGDCTKMVVHTVRVMPEAERITLWWNKYYIVENPFANARKQLALEDGIKEIRSWYK